MPRFFVDLPLAEGAELDLPAGAARHVQVLRLQPGHTLTLFNGHCPPWPFNSVSACPGCRRSTCT